MADGWQVGAVYLDPRWIAEQDPMADYAIARVSRSDGARLESVAGFSGAPWITGSTVTGLIGGLDGGGCAEEVSYSPPFDDGLTALVSRAQAGGGPGDEAPSLFETAAASGTQPSGSELVERAQLVHHVQRGDLVGLRERRVVEDRVHQVFDGAAAAHDGLTDVHHLGGAHR